MRVFVSYSPDDEDLKKELLAFFAPAIRRGVIAPWDPGKVLAGDEPARVNEAELDHADVALVLLSAKYLDHGGPADRDLQRIEERRASGALRVVFILASPCDWQSEQRIHQDLQVLPRDHRPLRSRSDRGEALLQVCREIIAMAPSPNPEEPSAPLAPQAAAPPGAAGSSAPVSPMGAHEPRHGAARVPTWAILFLVLSCLMLLLLSQLFHWSPALRCLMRGERCLTAVKLAETPLTPPAMVTPPPASTTPPELVSLTLPIVSIPSGATVWNADEVQLCITPCRLTVPAHASLKLHFTYPGRDYRWQTSDTTLELQRGGVRVNVPPLKVR